MFMLDHGLYRLLWRQIMSDSNHARPGRPSETLARRRAEVILKVRAGLLTATEAAKALGVSRKTYYQWENRGLQAMLEALSDRPTGRPAKETDPEKEALKRKVSNLEKELGLKQKGRAEFWRLFAWTLRHNPRCFHLYITFAIQGYHYRHVAANAGMGQLESQSM